MYWPCVVFINISGPKSFPAFFSCFDLGRVAASREGSECRPFHGAEPPVLTWCKSFRELCLLYKIVYNKKLPVTYSTRRLLKKTSLEQMFSATQERRRKRVENLQVSQKITLWNLFPFTISPFISHPLPPPSKRSWFLLSVYLKKSKVYSYLVNVQCSGLADPSV
jgi:hypothetical protein